MKSYIKDYPRPQLVRKSWKNLNGQWAFLFDDMNTGEAKGWFDKFPQAHEMIQVPFTYETKMSGIQDESHHGQVWYSRQITIEPSDMERETLLLHFEGSDYRTLVWMNGAFVGEHCGGYARFSFDVTKHMVPGSNVITVKAEDSKRVDQPRGKQRWPEDNFGCWYVQTTGIWKTVWLESVIQVYLSGLKMTPDVENGNIELVYDIAAEQLTDDMFIEAVITYDGIPVGSSCQQINRNQIQDTIHLYRPEITPWGVHMWTPENPALYDLEIRIKKDGKLLDEIFSYFGMRDIRISQGNILLNGTPLYQRLILDQGYWEDSHLTPPCEASLIDDIDKLLALGYNGLRKHMKTEDERFLY